MIAESLSKGGQRLCRHRPVETINSTTSLLRRTVAYHNSIEWMTFRKLLIQGIEYI